MYGSSPADTDILRDRTIDVLRAKSRSYIPVIFAFGTLTDCRSTKDLVDVLEEISRGSMLLIYVLDTVNK